LNGIKQIVLSSIFTYLTENQTVIGLPLGLVLAVDIVLIEKICVP